MPLSPEMYKGHERAHELVTQWRKNGYANGSGSDNIKMFEYLIHMEDEVENLMSDAPRPVAVAAGSVGDSKLQSRITELEGQLRIAQAGGPAKPQTTSAAVKTVLADLETAEERIAALEQENNELASLAFAAVVGSIMVSYVRARVEGAGGHLTDGVFTRVERVILLGVVLIVGWLRAGLWVLAVERCRHA